MNFCLLSLAALATLSVPSNAFFFGAGPMIHKMVPQIPTSSTTSLNVKLKKAKWENVDRTLLKDSSGASKTTGTVAVTFTQGEETRTTMAIPGQGLTEVASQADQFIKYKCKKGECGTCEVKVDGQWVRSCVTRIPGGVTEYNVDVRPSMVPQTKKASGFFSVTSFADGFRNNALGMVGLVTEGSKEDDNFNHRISEEDAIKEMVRKKKAAREAAGKAKH